MAAGLGFKTFTTGEVLTAADVNGYLMQGINVFASSAARSAAITSPQKGQYSFLKDTNALEYYDGAAWVGAPVGDITAVTAGKGLTGGGSSGDVTVSLGTTAKGDLVAGSGTTTAAVLSVGANNTVLTADSTASTGLKWAAASSGTFPVLTTTSAGGDFTTTSTSYVDVTNMTITRTPVSATNKIEVKASFSVYTGGNVGLDWKMLAGATGSGLAYGRSTHAAGYTLCTLLFYFTNVAASSTVYKLQMKTDGGSVTLYGSNAGFNNNFSVFEVY